MNAANLDVIQEKDAQVIRNYRLIIAMLNEQSNKID